MVAMTSWWLLLLLAHLHWQAEAAAPPASSRTLTATPTETLVELATPTLPAGATTATSMLRSMTQRATRTTTGTIIAQENDCDGEVHLIPIIVPPAAFIILAAVLFLFWRRRRAGARLDSSQQGSRDRLNTHQDGQGAQQVYDSDGDADRLGALFVIVSDNPRPVSVMTAVVGCGTRNVRVLIDAMSYSPPIRDKILESLRAVCKDARARPTAAVFIAVAGSAPVKDKRSDAGGGIVPHEGERGAIPQMVVAAELRKLPTGCPVFIVWDVPCTSPLWGLPYALTHDLAEQHDPDHSPGIAANVVAMGSLGSGVGGEMLSAFFDYLEETPAGEPAKCGAILEAVHQRLQRRGASVTPIMYSSKPLRADTLVCTSLAPEGHDRELMSVRPASKAPVVATAEQKPITFKTPPSPPQRPVAAKTASAASLLPSSITAPARSRDVKKGYEEHVENADNRSIEDNRSFTGWLGQSPPEDPTPLQRPRSPATGRLQPPPPAVATVVIPPGKSIPTPAVPPPHGASPLQASPQYQPPYPTASYPPSPSYEHRGPISTRGTGQYDHLFTNLPYSHRNAPPPPAWSPVSSPGTAAPRRESRAVTRERPPRRIANATAAPPPAAHPISTTGAHISAATPPLRTAPLSYGTPPTTSHTPRRTSSPTYMASRPASPMARELSDALYSPTKARGWGDTRPPRASECLIQCSSSRTRASYVSGRVSFDGGAVIIDDGVEPVSIPIEEIDRCGAEEAGSTDHPDRTLFIVRSDLTRTVLVFDTPSDRDRWIGWIHTVRPESVVILPSTFTLPPLSPRAVRP
eukprot:Sspe_Gene.38152::Locus_18397_Transcript_1_3_Confidence_0.333_Length_2603::g.38152::m.38152